MNGRSRLAELRREAELELTERLLPYWMDRAVDHRNGGFVGRIGADERACPDAPKAAVLNTRILWTFAAAYRVLREPAYLAMADRAHAFLADRLLDPVHDGVFWMVDAGGAPHDDRKHVYAQAFAIYALAEHFRATGAQRSLQRAVTLFRLVEARAAEAAAPGYAEAFTREWQRLDDPRLDPADPGAPRSMNTHLHLLEAYTNLYRAWPDALLGRRLRALLKLFLEVVFDPATGHLGGFFDEQWRPCASVVSFGHEIEASWLLLDAAEALGDAPLAERATAASVRLATGVLRHGLDPIGGVFGEADGDGIVADTDKEWWPQAEAVIGFVRAYGLTGDAAFLDAACSTWAFARRHLSDPVHGEWFRRVARDGRARSGHEKAGPWKCPYHNARMCLELMERVGVDGALAAAMELPV